MKATIELNETNFDTEVLKATQPVLVDFWAEWCGPCKMIAPALEEIATEYGGRAKIAKVNIDENPALAARFGVRSIPTLLFFSNGQVKEQVVGAAGKKVLVSKLQALT
ncbi:MAG TPA: thioredoxin [Candidatus Paceibacterota bacterium]|nr:thioredoxin [Candidatus Paceibacterota bacterium]